MGAFCMMIAVIASRCRRLRRGGVVWQHPMVLDDQPQLLCRRALPPARLRDHRATIITAAFLVGKTPWIAHCPACFVLTTALGDLVESQVKRDSASKT